MFAKFRNCSLFQQLIMPLLVVGIVGVTAVIISAIVLQNSVAALGGMYEAGGQRLKVLQEIDKEISNYRALSLKHLASESAVVMTKIDADLNAAKRRINDHAAPLASANGHQLELANSSGALLNQALKGYFAGIDDAIEASTEFEKEHAFELLTGAETDYLWALRNELQGLTRQAFEALSASRENLVDAAQRNLRMTIAIGILGGGLLLLMAFYVTRRASRRIGDLLAWSERIANGDMKSMLSSDSGDEIGQLTLAMRAMVENIGRGRADLEAAKAVAEKTADELRLYANAFESSGEPILVTDRANHIINVNPAFVLQTGYSLDDVYGKDPKILSTGQTPPEVYRDMWSSLQATGYWSGELWDRKKSGEIYPKWTSISVIRDENQAIMFHFASFADISERKANEARIDYLAHHDALTGLINRFNLENRLSQALLSAQRDTLFVAVMFIDLDRFKTINDTLGHHIGDLLLIEVARRLRDSLRESDIVARQGGDEFVVALADLANGMEAAPVAEKILRALGKPYLIHGNELHTSPSIGVAIYPHDGQDGATLLKNADTAMYHAKESGRNNVQYFTPAMNSAASERLQLENDLRYAMAAGQLSLHYQPQVCALEGIRCGFEALARWRHPTLGDIPPLIFIPIAEESGLIEILGNWVINEACRQLAAWRAEGFRDIRIAVNLSAHQLRAPDLAGFVAGVLDKHGLRGHDLELEITESVAMENPERAIVQLQALRDLGVLLAIDDFGTGYSSLAYLKRLPIQVLKLDRAFVGDIEQDISDAEICAGTLALAHNLGLKVIAEGVETLAQRDFLVGHECDFLQGFLYGKPLPADLVTTYLRDQASADTAGFATPAGSPEPPTDPSPT